MLGTEDVHLDGLGICHRPLYFEDEQLERYGHTRGPLQYVISPAKFFVTFPILPYEMGLCPPRECIYTLGTYRPGDCSPYYREAIPLSLRASLFEAGFWTGGVFASIVVMIVKKTTVAMANAEEESLSPGGTANQ